MVNLYSAGRRGSDKQGGGAVAIHRTFYISDIHLSSDEAYNAEGMGPNQTFPFPYTWSPQNRRDELADFLQWLKRENVADELVILGDLFDNWLLPVSVKPSSGTLKKIRQAKGNKKVFDALSALVDAGTPVSYTPGNHDMMADKALLSSVNKKIRFCGDPDNVGLGVYMARPTERKPEGLIHAEHGHRFCLFNAPDTSTNPPHLLPLGYFMTRTEATCQAMTGKGILGHEHKLLDNAMRELGRRGLSDISGTVIRTMWKTANLTDDDSFTMTGIDRFVGTKTINEVARTYGNTYDDWPDISECGVDSYNALLDDAGGEKGNNLEAGAKRVKNATPARVIVMGHTHFAKVVPYGRTVGTKKCQAVYANAGAWTEEVAAPTFIETVDDTDAKNVTVNRYSYSIPNKAKKSGQSGYFVTYRNPL